MPYIMLTIAIYFEIYFVVILIAVILQTRQKRKLCLMTLFVLQIGLIFKHVNWFSVLNPDAAICHLLNPSYCLWQLIVHSEWLGFIPDLSNKRSNNVLCFKVTTARIFLWQLEDAMMLLVYLKGTNSLDSITDSSQTWWQNNSHEINHSIESMDYM